MQKFDFHCHCFPDALAAKAIPALAAAAGIAARGDGTASGLAAAMARDGVAGCAVLGISVTPAQQEKVNAFAASLAERPGFVPFGSVHPGAPGALEALDGFAERGLRGVKLHPEYQNVDFADACLHPIFARCQALGLPVLVHAGRDFAYPDTLRCPPEALLAVSERFPRLTIIAAHLGGFGCWDAVEKQLVGSRIYLDTSMAAGYIPPEQARRILRGHTPGRVLFGSDWPWHTAAEEEAFLLSLGLEDALLEQIFFQNAQALLNC